MSIFEVEQSSMIICSIKSDKNNVQNNSCRCTVFEKQETYIPWYNIKFKKKT